MQKGRKILNNINATKAQVDQYIELFAVAHKAKENAHCRYSGFQVGAALLANDKKVITGCNVENASYGLTICAERTAIFKAVSDGYKPGDFKAIAIAANSSDFSPCGACRQVINEFGDDISVIFEFGNKIIITKLADILPYNFKLETCADKITIPTRGDGLNINDKHKKMLRRVSKSFYQNYIEAVRQAVADDNVDPLIKRASAERPDIDTVKFRIRAMASAVRQGYDF